MTKTRIKVEARADGSVFYYAQYKKGFFWYYIAYHGLLGRIGTPILKDAQHEIDSFLKSKAYEAELKARTKTVSTKYIKYP